MKKPEIQEILNKGGFAAKDIDGCCGVVLSGAWEDIRKDQFAKLHADLSKKVEHCTGSVYRIKVHND